MLTYESSRKCFPGYANWIGANHTIPGSWVVAILPYLEKVDMYNLWASYPSSTFASDLSSLNLTAAANPYMKVLLCPSDSPDSTSDAWCSYVCNRGCNGWNYPYLGVCMDQATPTIPNPPASSSISVPPVTVSLDYINSHDGTSTTLLLAENLLTNPPAGSGSQIFVPRVSPSGSTGTPWGKWSTPLTCASATGSDPGTANATTLLPQKSPFNNDLEACVGFEWSQWSATPKLSDKLLSRHPGGVNVAFCDGHMQFLSDNIDVTAFKMLMTPYGNGIPAAITTGIIPWVESTWNGSAWTPWTTSTASGTISSTVLPPAGYLLDESKF
jgi:prepilin-type processing-associated H-X9-DG protein